MSLTRDERDNWRSADAGARLQEQFEDARAIKQADIRREAERDFELAAEARAAS